MKILFLCGFLEPGRCGVGDYTRRLAAEVMRQGHDCAIIALNDVFIDEEFEGSQPSGQVDIPVYRLPSSTPKAIRFSKAKNWLEQYNPDWVSLQFVLFSFNEKGLPFGLANDLARIIGKKPLEIMFHELWLGLEKEATLKIKMWGWVQKKIIGGMINTLKPKVVHTQTQLHVLELDELGVSAAYLPLISNIAIKSNSKIRSVSPREEISMVIFGSIYFGAPIADFAKEAGEYSRKSGLTVTIISVGRNRKGSETLVEICKSEGLELKVLGEQPEEKISEILSNSSVGISTTPFPLAEKSGTVIAMREHGLPVICVSREYTPKQKTKMSPLDGVVQYQPGEFNSFMDRIKISTPIDHSVTKVARQFLLPMNTKNYKRNALLRSI